MNLTLQALKGLLWMAVRQNNSERVNQYLLEIEKKELTR